jgi:hypothetical protein
VTVDTPAHDVEDPVPERHGGAHGRRPMRGLVPLMVCFGGLTLAFSGPGLGATGHGAVAVAAAVAGVAAAAGGLVGLARG